MNQICQTYCVFHLNLAFSSIDKKAHGEVIEKCYWPLLDIINKSQVPLGIELTVYTLEAINKVDSKWIDKFRELLQKGLCELIGSGDSQIIGPLVPAEVNQHNLHLGQQGYLSLLGIKPNLAYINEQAVSTGLLDVYIDAGFDAVVVEWDNPYAHNQDWSDKLLNRPQSLMSASGRTIKVIWNNAMVFQKLQHYAHGEIVQKDYFLYLDKVKSSGCKALSVYGSDAEVFNYRPGRYQTEAGQIKGEWQRIASLFQAIKESKSYQWILPSDALKHWKELSPLTISSAAHPISVKKQQKYNITRWGLSGRNDLYLNSLCYKKYKGLKLINATDKDWQSLCRLWASDYRTHITTDRFATLNNFFQASGQITKINYPKIEELAPYKIFFDNTTNRLSIKSKSLHLMLNINRGMSIETLAFASHEFNPVCGTLTHGFFDHINFGADFYSNHMVIERFRERDRVTDLIKIDWQMKNADGYLLIEGELPTAQGILIKSYLLKEQSVKCSFSFKNKQRPEASLRLGFITLLNCQSSAWFSCSNGGLSREHFVVENDINHGAPVSSIVSSNSALGATTGELFFGNDEHGVHLTWNPEDCAALPMISSQKTNNHYLNRLWFSMVEADETLKQGGYLPDFSYTIQPTTSTIAQKNK